MQEKQQLNRQLKSFGLITGLATAVVFGLFLPWLFDHGYPRWPWIVTMILWFFCPCSPAGPWTVIQGLAEDWALAGVVQYAGHSWVDVLHRFLRDRSYYALDGKRPLDKKTGQFS